VQRTLETDQFAQRAVEVEDSDKKGLWRREGTCERNRGSKAKEDSKKFHSGGMEDAAPPMEHCSYDVVNAISSLNFFPSFPCRSQLKMPHSKKGENMTATGELASSFFSLLKGNKTPLFSSTLSSKNSLAIDRSEASLSLSRSQTKVQLDPLLP
jgi:hypothetical protein